MKLLKFEEIKEILQRAQDATPGPWVVQERPVDDFLIDRCITTDWADPKLEWPSPVVGVTQSEYGAATWIEPNNAAFIAAARADIPQLLATLAVFGQTAVYEALLSYYRNNRHKPEEAVALEQAMDTCWQLIRSRRDGSGPTQRL